MNTRNNQQFQRTGQRIEQCFLELLDQREIERITVRMICERAGVHRSTFYAHYQDVYDLLDRARQRLNRDLAEQLSPLMKRPEFYRDAGLYVRMLAHLRQHRNFYHACLKKRRDFPVPDGQERIWEEIIRPDMERSGERDEEAMRYRLTFCQAGVTMIFRRWLDGGCREPEEWVARRIVECIAPR